MPSNGLAVMLCLTDARAVVVGGGPVATRKISSLLPTGAQVVVIAPSVEAAIDRWAHDGRLIWHARRYLASDLEHADLVVVATSDDSVNRTVVHDARARRLLVNDASASSGGSSGSGGRSPAPGDRALDVSLLATLERGDVTVAVGTEGGSPALASWLRDRLDRQVGDELATLAAAANGARRALLDRDVHPSRSDWHRAFDSVMLDDIDLLKTGQIDLAKERLLSCLSSSSD